MKLLSIERLAIYLLTFFAILAISFILLNGFWKQLDHGIYKVLYMDNAEAQEKLSPKIVVVDIEKPNLDSKDASLGIFRKRIISFLNTVGEHQQTNNEHSEAILLDISFSKDSIQLEELKQAIKAIKAKRIKVYAIYSLINYFEKTPIFEANELEQASVLYDSLLDGGRLHAAFVVANDLISYPSDLFLTGAFVDTVKIESIIKRVTLDENSSHFNPGFQQLVTPLGPQESMMAQTYSFVEPKEDSIATGTFIPKDADSPALDLDDKFILVGDLKNDYQQDIATPRTFFMAWALNEKIIPEKIVKQPLDSITVKIGQTLFFSFFTVLIFAFLFKYIKTLQTKPKTLAVLAFVIGLLFFAIYGALVYSFEKIIPVGLTLIGMLIATILAWRFAYKFLVTGVAEGSQKYDVFISYSHGNSEWVKKNVYQPLLEYRKPNGDKLEIFFDEKSIGIGEAFTSKYMWGIVDSKFFIPVISEEYYKKNHCRNEMDLAYKRYVEKLLHLLPIAFSFASVPEIYNHINFADITVNPNFMDKIKEELEK